MSCSCNNCNDITLFSGNPGENGIYGGHSSKWKFSTDITAPPLESYIEFNNAVLANVTQIYVNDKNADSTDMTAFLQSFNIASFSNLGLIRIYKEFDANTFWIGELTNSADSTTHYTLSVNHIQSNGTFLAEDNLVLSYTPLAQYPDWEENADIVSSVVLNDATNYSQPVGYTSMTFTNTSGVNKDYEVYAKCLVGNLDGATYPLTAGQNVNMAVLIDGLLTTIGAETSNYTEMAAAATGLKGQKTLTVHTSLAGVSPGAVVTIQFKVSGGPATSPENAQLNSAYWMYRVIN